MEPLGLHVGLRLQLALEDLAATLVLAQRLRALAGRGIEPHQQAMRFLPRRIEIHQPLSRSDRLGAGSRGRQPLQHADGKVVEPRVLRTDPILERGIGHAMTVEQRAAIERGRLVPSAGLRQPLEFDGVDGDQRRIKTDRIILGTQCRQPAQQAADVRQRLAQAGPRLFITAVAPQQRHQLLTRPRLSRRQGKAGQNGADLAPGRVRSRALPHLQAESAKQMNMCKFRSLVCLAHRPHRPAWPHRDGDFTGYSRRRQFARTAWSRPAYGRRLE